MTRVDLGAGADVAPVLRYPLSVKALELLAERTGTPLPWRDRADPSGMAHRLGSAVVGRPGTGDAPAELARHGLLTSAGVHAGLATALDGFADPRAHVDLDLALRRATGTTRMHSWHRHHATGVTAVTAAGDAVELAWWPGARWAAELARTVTPTGLPTRAPAPTRCSTPAAYLRMPYELLLASGPAVRETRPGVLAELVERHRDRVFGPGGTALTPASVNEQVVLLHTGERGRLQVRVTGGGRRVEPGPGAVQRRDRRFGLVAWVLFDDGWRELTPAPSAGEPAVVVRAVEPASLGGIVALLVEAVAA